MIKIYYWPSGDWCTENKLETYITDLSLSDNYRVIFTADSCNNQLFDFYLIKLLLSTPIIH
jgi:hypothetical protein